MQAPRHWRLNAQRYRLVGQLCNRCNQAIFPPRPTCPRCLTTAKGEGISLLSKFEVTALGSNSEPVMVVRE